MKKNYYLIFIIIFCILCSLICLAGWQSVEKLQAYRREYDMLYFERNNFTRTMENLYSRNSALRQAYNINLESADDEGALSFHDQIIKTLENNNIDIVSLNQEKPDSNIITMSLRGNYYDFAHLLAEWRNLSLPTRLNLFSFRLNDSRSENYVDVNAVIESLRE